MLAQINRRAEDGSDGALGIALVRVVLVRGFGFAAHGGLADADDLGGAVGGNGGLRTSVLFQQREHVGDGQGNLLLQTAGGRVIGAVHGVSDGKGLVRCGCRLLCDKQPTALWVINGRIFTIMADFPQDFRFDDALQIFHGNGKFRPAFDVCAEFADVVFEG